MFKRINQFFSDDLPFIKTQLGLLVSQKKSEPYDVTLLRHLLGSVDLKDIQPLADLKEQERKDFAAGLAVQYPKIEQVIKQLVEDQKEFALTHTGDYSFSKGTLNGLYLVLEAFEDWRNEHVANTIPKPEPGKDFDEHASLPELLERFSRPSGLPNNSQEQRSA